MAHIIEIKNLFKHFENQQVLCNISVDINEGEIIGLLGANGAGKTTFLKILSGLLKPSEGTITMFSSNPWINRDKTLNRLGILIETPVFYEHLTVFENISIHLEYMGVEADIDEILSLVNLVDVKDTVVSKLSLGMKQRLAIARSISHRPNVLLLDEPINGLDPVSIKMVREIFIKLKKSGTTIILSSHLLGELLETAESIIVISNGQLKELGAISLLKEVYKENLENYLIEEMS